jgi:hypothetical protein
MELTLSKIKTIGLYCDAVVAENALGFRVDRKLSELSMLCEGMVKNDKRLRDLLIRTKEFISQPNGSQPEEIELLRSQEREIMDAPIDHFEPEAIQVTATDEIACKFKNASLEIIFMDRKYTVNPYASLHYLIREGIIKIND